MPRVPATKMHRDRAVVVALACLCCCLLFVVRASSAADISFSSGLRDLQLHEMEAPASVLGVNDQVVFVAAATTAGEAEEAGDGGVKGRMDLELEDYPGSGANDRHSPWGQQRRN